jgi:hypothetical protein
VQYKLVRSDDGALELLSDGMQCGYHAEVTDVALISPCTVAVAPGLALSELRNASFEPTYEISARCVKNIKRRALQHSGKNTPPQPQPAVSLRGQRRFVPDQI